jgi:PhnB protein
VNSNYNPIIQGKMATVSTYLYFANETEEAFTFYKSVFETEFEGGGMMRFSDIPQSDDMPAIPETDLNLVMHVSLPILGGHRLMGTDTPEAMGYKLEKGNNVYINLQPDTRKETRQLFDALSAGGKIEQELQNMFWGDYYGSCIDKFGVKWMFNCDEKEE